jgi:hypothetical protein
MSSQKQINSYAQGVLVLREYKITKSINLLIFIIIEFGL